MAVLRDSSIFSVLVRSNHCISLRVEPVVDSVEQIEEITAGQCLSLNFAH